MNNGGPTPVPADGNHVPDRAPAQPAARPPGDATPRVADHDLLRVIGRGSYGAVWLARNILGEFRAVKVIYRRAFEHDRPYEREVEGIRKFEPVSRAHPSQLNVLHVGRNDAAGYFYYVMELADDAQPGRSHGAAGSSSGQAPRPLQDSGGSAPGDPETYTPHTLKHDLDQRGRLPVEDCVRLGLALTTALEHLHEHGLVHRDVKPSNIIYVHGLPKLADIGLVAGMDATMSFVGTSGFLPPEGPGTPKADLYSLGKVLYEMAMGRDRQEFPKLPADFSAWEDPPARLLELNAVILKACHSDPRQRYQSARELAADLLLLQRGHSVRRLRLVERRLAVATRAGLAAFALLLLAAALYGNAARQERATARQLYVADMNRAQQAWEGGNLTLTRELLQTHRQRHPELLGFEWRLLAWLCTQSDARLTLRGHTGIVWSVAVSPAGDLLATASGDRTVRLWETASGRLQRTLVGHQNFVHAVAFSPDGRLLATGSRDFSVKLWDPCRGLEIATLQGHKDAVRAVAFSLDGQTLVSAGEDKSLRWWSLALTQEVACILTGFTVEQLGISTDGQTLAGCGADTRVHFWSCATRGERPALALHQANVISVAYSTDGRTLATGSYDGTIRLWDPVEERELAVLGRGAPVCCVAFAPGGRILAAATEDGLVRLWDTTRHTVLATLRGHTANVRTLAFSPKGDRLATGDENAVAKLWDLAPEPGRENALLHSGIVNSFAFSPDGRTLATTDCVRDTLCLWKVEDQRAMDPIRGEKHTIWSVAYAPDGLALVTGGVDGTVRLWSKENGAELAVLRGHAGGVDGVAFSPDGCWIASASRDATAKVWRRSTGREAATLPSAGGVVRAVAFSPDGTTLACGCGDGHLLLWDARTFQRQAALAGHAGEIRGISFSPDGRFLASGGVDRVIRLWDWRRRKIVGTLAGHTAMISSLAFSPDGRTLASGSWDSTVKLWNVRLGREVATLKDHSGQVTHVGFSADGSALASASADGTVRLWRAAPPR
jgi:WD40 repeat protein